MASMQTSNTDPNQRKVMESFLTRYAVTVLVDDLTNEGVVLRDNGGRKVAPAYGEIRGDMIHTGHPYADIMIIGVQEGVLIGWVHADTMTDVGDRCLVPVKSLNKMPNTFNFVQECPHMAVYGGVHTEDRKGWECLGCGKTIVLQ